MDRRILATLLLLGLLAPAWTLALADDAGDDADIEEVTDVAEVVAAPLDVTTVIGRFHPALVHFPIA